ncbi:MAG: hypothetical protein A2428_03025 [Bdellovibrionales bacterium RIFOXYC1_FULL_54_43]|nr:MAG: hypothetical protein A2428_03025 [Bdellovibrionales bacterium RIFOXYC1_FULL_54_43]OFZ82654.1 MAG: hypothetical protein A2603_02460 [Bdellovibrionales bacterium RIFOXYD1_FULL_55_31]
MRRIPVIHKIRHDDEGVGGVYEMWCGLRFFREPDPTPEQARDIEESFSQSPICKRCLKAQKKFEEARG